MRPRVPGNTRQGEVAQRRQYGKGFAGRTPARWRGNEMLKHRRKAGKAAARVHAFLLVMCIMAFDAQGHFAELRTRLQLVECSVDIAQSISAVDQRAQAGAIHEAEHVVELPIASQAGAEDL